MRSSLRLLVAVVVMVAAVPLLTGASDGDRSRSDQARDEHQRIVEFWTPARVAQAVPRDFVLDPGSGRLVPTPGKPSGTPGGGRGGGGGGGGDDGGSTVVSGASWNGGGEIDGASGKLLFAMGGSYWVCSATVIDDGDDSDNDNGNGSALILTAAHCVYDQTNDAFATVWMFIPDYDAASVPLDSEGTFCDSTEYGCWTKEAMAVHDGYALADSFGDALAYDFAVVRVGEGGKSGNAELDHVVAEQKYSFAGPVASLDGHAFGYPAEKKWKGNDLIYCYGPIDGDPLNAGDTYRLDECKLNGGSSGGPWLAPFDEGTGEGTVISVNSYRYRGINAMHGPFLNADTKAVYAAAAATEGNEVVVGP